MASYRQGLLDNGSEKEFYVLFRSLYVCFIFYGFKNFSEKENLYPFSVKQKIM